MALFLRVSSPSCSIWNGNRGEFPVSSTKCRAQLQRSSSDEATDPNSTSTSSSQSTIESLERLTGSSTDSNRGNTIASKLTNRYGDEGSDFSVPLVYSRTKKPKISVQRNIKRQEYLDKVAERDDSGTFATIGLFVLVPPLAILAVAVAVGYVQILP